MQQFKAYCACLVRSDLAPTALRVAIVVGTLLLCINHGGAILRHEMTTERWCSAILAYLMPYLVNIHGQFTKSQRL
jgi:hypothetical protein